MVYFLLTWSINCVEFNLRWKLCWTGRTAFCRRAYSSRCEGTEKSTNSRRVRFCQFAFYFKWTWLEDDDFCFQRPRNLFSQNTDYVENVIQVWQRRNDFKIWFHCSQRVSALNSLWGGVSGHVLGLFFLRSALVGPLYLKQIFRSPVGTSLPHIFLAITDSLLMQCNANHIHQVYLYLILLIYISSASILRSG